ncbi:DM13 domain-containing protein [Polaribacter haliotis]|uniref:DM13 domain-containing protein n=1 Tax=Polaribacter haliotis TaxID=1888915 RepID=A0A7L8AEF5_9FLAO|nr:DM13 domain-containing protein [Polaribacter haliotis]QOD60390.1 DM13 domain-containing protein [Polaribacter haliotis]
MKTTLLSLFFALIFSQSYGQCSEIVSGFGNNPDDNSYNVTGDVSLTLNTNNTITLNLASNFSTASGPDVRAFLVESGGKSDAVLAQTLIADLNHFEIGLTQPNGAQTYTIAIPDGKDITKFDKIFFYCLQYNHFWDLGTFNNFTSSSCSILSVNNFDIQKIKVYPNPAKNEIRIGNMKANTAEIRIFNVLGKKVFYQQKNTGKALDVSYLQPGVYMVKISVENASKTQKLVIQ